MTAAELLSRLRKHDIRVTADNGRLIVNGPKGALTSELRAQLLGCKEEVLNFLNTIVSSAWRDDPVLQRISRDRTFCLSFAQQRLWFLDQYEPNSSVYNVASALRLKGSLNIGALEQSLNEIIRRHESLRTTLSIIDGEPVQVIAPSLVVCVPVIDLRDHPEGEREQNARQLANEEARQPFALAQGPLFRSKLLRLGEDEHVLLLAMHHIVSDGWSMGVLHRELTVLYEAFSRSQPSPLADLPIQYADYAVWQRQWLQGEVLDRQLSYWKKQLGDIPAVLSLATDRPRPAVQSFRGKRQSIELSKELTQHLKALSRKKGVTLFMTLLAAFQTLLYRYTGQQNIVVGSPIANRNRAEIEGLIGFFVNTLVLRANFSGNPTFKELLAQVRETVLGAYAHQDLPFEKLVEELQPERSLSYSPLFQAVFVLQNTPSTAVKFEGLSSSQVSLAAEVVKFDLELSMHETEEGLRGSLQYRTDLFDPATIARMTGHLQTLLEGIHANPDQHISRLPILTEVERHQLLVEWNPTPIEYPKDKCIHALFERQVEKTPDAVAVVFKNQQLTYRQLNTRANQLAHYLHKQGVGPESLVGICVEQSLEMVVGLLGILKAGGAYVPLDPEYPKERLAFMLEDTRSTVLLTQQRFVEKFSNLNTRLVCLDRDWPQIAEETQENAQNKVTADNTAYIIYTSGTTGQPKGVMISHDNISRLFRVTAAWFHFSNNDVWTMFHSYAFDFSVWEMWGALLYGGRVVIVPFWISRSPEKFYELLGREKVTVLNQTPSAFRQLIQADQSASNQTNLALRLIIFGGEALDFQSLRPWLDRHGDQYPQLVNMYGITETTVHVTYRVVRSSDVKEGVGSLIGMPLPDLSLYVLDKHRQLVPIGIPGELYVGGAGVGRGYLNRPELTDERFIANPFNERKADKLYKTGDLVRRLSNGDIEYLGRTDAQVKIRGFRIELGEIEAILSQHPAVREAVVIAREESDNPKSEIENLKLDKRLVAYVVLRSGRTADAAAVRSFLKEKLPVYMVPSVFVLLDSLPLTPNGKIDRNALPAPDERRPELEEVYVAPRTPVEEMIAEIWAEVLKVRTVGVHDNFFDLGGHSLLATRAMSRICQAFEVELPLRALFERPTVAELAKRIEEARGQDQRLTTRPILPVSRDQVLPLSFAQQRLWFLDQYEPNSSLYNIPGALRLRGSLDVAALEQSLNQIMRRHESLRTTFSMVDGEPVQVIAPPAGFSLAVVDLSEDPGGEREEEARRLVAEEARRPFDLAKGPLFRSKLLRLGEDEHVLLLAMHHIVSDGWSMGVLHRELTVLYEAFSRSQPSPLADLPIQYADYAVWQREWLQGEVLESQISYWKRQLEGIPALLNLPADHPRPAVQSYRGARQSLELSEDVTQGLKALSRKEGVTLFMTLLAACQTLLYRYTGQEDVVVGSPIANRNRTEIEGLIGFFVNTLVLRTNFSGNSTFKELLAQVREMTLGAYAHQDLPFEKLVEEINPERSLSHSPLFQVMFVLQNARDTALKFEGLRASPVRIGAETAKFDFLLSMSESVNGLKGSLQYNRDLFEEHTIIRMLGHFRVLLEGVVANPNQRLDRLPLLTQAEKHQQLVDWNVTTREYPKDKRIHELFEAQVERSPDAVAVVFEGRELTYRELNQKANQLAHYLRAHGVAPEVLVGICMGRSLEMVVGLLGILKAGGAYVPLDSEYPKDRLAFMMADTRAAVLLTQARLIPYLPECCARVVCLDRDWEAIAKESDQNLDSRATAENLVYVIYTSGSTGRPKGIAMSHRPLCNLLSWQVENFTHPFTLRTLQFASLSFDVSFQEIFATWCSGGTLVLTPEELRRDPSGLLHYLQDQSVERLFLPFVALHQLAEVADQERTAPKSLREIITAGEQLHITPPIVALFSQLSDCKLRNQYGPSETHVVSAFTPAGSPSDWPALPSIGRPIANSKIYILDRYQKPVPIGVTGEIWIGGAGLACGYLNRAELTAEKFIPDPFSDERGARLYKTGDLARYQPDGNMEFLGRIDDQVKIRGFRIELREVEAVLDNHPAVRQIAVVVREDVPGNKRLVAYVVLNQDQAATVSELRAFLQAKLPNFMIPSGFVFLDSLPLTPNGKLDRQGLPPPDQNRPDLERSFLAPRTFSERLLTAIWAQILKLDKIGVHENFFDLGGHSLLATQIVSRIRETFEIELPLRKLFEKPTIAELAELITQERYRKMDSADMLGILTELEAMSDEEAQKSIA